MKETFDRKSC